MEPMVLGMWAACGACVLIVCGILLFVIYEGKRSNRQEEKEEAERIETGSDTPSVYVIPVPDSDGEDEVFEGAPQSLKILTHSRSSVTEIYMRTKSYSEGSGSIPLNVSLDSNSNLRC